VEVVSDQRRLAVVVIDIVTGLVLACCAGVILFHGTFHLVNPLDAGCAGLAVRWLLKGAL
jgi:hypothetical protein